MYRLEFAAPDVCAVIELEVPAHGLVRFDARFSGDAIGDGLIVVRDEEVPRARGAQLEFLAK